LPKGLKSNSRADQRAPNYPVIINIEAGSIGVREFLFPLGYRV
jgi:hypothetical protein